MIALAVIFAAAGAGEKDLRWGKPCDGFVVEHKGYTLCWNEDHEQAEWVSYHLRRKELQSRRAERKDMQWREDQAIASGSSHRNDYFKSGYDRGHLAPAADMKWSVKASVRAF